MKFHRLQILAFSFAAILGLSLFSASCDLIDTDPDIEAVITVESMTPPIGVAVVLDGSNSTYEGNSPTFSWSLEKPAGSESMIQNQSAQVANFIPDMKGDFIVTLVVRAEGVEDSRTITLAVGGGDVQISNDITQNTIFYSENRYFITSNITVRNARLTIQPGAQIRFDQGTHLRVGSDGIFAADGTEDEPIVFTGTSQTRGWWNGLYFAGTTHPHNLLNHVIIEYGGGQAHHGSTMPANLTIARDISNNAASLTMTNSTLRHSGGFGLFLHQNGSMPGSANNTYTQNQSGPAAADASSLHFLDDGSDYVGNINDRDAVHVIGNSVSGNVTWQSLNAPYFVLGNISISDSQFRIEPGATFSFDAETSFQIGSGVIISISGTEDAPITFTASQQTPGWWNGMYILGTTHPNNIMEHVVIEYGGRTSFHGTTDPANLTIARSISNNAARVSLKNVTLRNSAGLGLSLHYFGSIPNSMNNTFTGNAEGPARAYTSGAHYFDSNSSYSGNGNNDYLWIIGDTQNETAAWQALDVPYGMSGESRVTGGTLTINPGASFSFDVDAGLVFRENVILAVSGTATDPILFTASQQSPGWWRGIHVSGTINPNNKIEHVIVEYGGSNAWHGSVAPANLTVGRSISSNNAQLEVRNSTFRLSDGQGVHVHSGSQVNADICAVNTFENNASDGCVVME